MDLNKVDRTPTKQLSRRSLFKAAGFAGIGVAAATIDLGIAPAANAAPRLSAAAVQAGHGQDGWEFCTDCRGMYWPHSKSRGYGVCATGGSHESTQTDTDYFFLESDSVGQTNWRWCNKCTLMFWGGSDGGVCPAGGRHSSTGSANYNVWYDGNTYGAGPGVGTQPDWHYCSACNGLVWHTNSSVYYTQCPATGHNHYHGSRDNIVGYLT